MFKIFASVLGIPNRRALSAFMRSDDSSSLRRVMRKEDLSLACCTLSDVGAVHSIRLEGVHPERLGRINSELNEAGYDMRCVSRNYDYFGICAVRNNH